MAEPVVNGVAGCLRQHEVQAIRSVLEDRPTMKRMLPLPTD